MCQHVSITSELIHDFYDPWHEHPVVFMGTQLAETLRQ
jgi:hypothetical protein